MLSLNVHNEQLLTAAINSAQLGFNCRRQHRVHFMRLPDAYSAQVGV